MYGVAVIETALDGTKLGAEKNNRLVKTELLYLVETDRLQLVKSM